MAPNVQGIAPYTQEIASNAKGIVFYTKGIAPNAQGIGPNAQGTQTGVARSGYPTSIYSIHAYPKLFDPTRNWWFSMHMIRISDIAYLFEI